MIGPREVKGYINIVPKAMRSTRPTGTDSNSLKSSRVIRFRVTLIRAIRNQIGRLFGVRAPQPLKDRMHVLLVGDDSVNEKRIRRILASVSKLHRVEGIPAAIEAVRQGQFHLILLDHDHRISSGCDPIIEIRAACPEVPVFVLTGVAEDAVETQLVDGGAPEHPVMGHVDGRSMRPLGIAGERDALIEQLREEQQQRTELEASIREQEQQLLHFDRLSLISEAVSDLSHEVSQPLQTVSSLVTVLQAKDLTEPDRDIVRRMSECLALAQEILRRTRDLARKESPPMTLVDLKLLVGDSIRFVEHELKQLDAECIVEMHPNDLMVTGQRVELQQVLANLLRNAIDALKVTDKAPRCLKIRALRDGNQARVDVFDNGGGITIAWDSAFAPFVTTKDNGLGMGLAICRRIVERHHGEISADSNPLGTTVRFSLPLQADA